MGRFADEARQTAQVDLGHMPERATLKIDKLARLLACARLQNLVVSISVFEDENIGQQLHPS